MTDKIKISLLAIALALVSCGEGDIIPVPKPEQPQEEKFEMGSVPDCVPVVEIAVAGGTDIVSKDEYLRVQVTIKENDQVVLQTAGKAKGRGNYTWHGYPKKPYKIKLDDKHEVCGFPENKDWVLLADYCDKSLMRTANHDPNMYYVLPPRKPDPHQHIWSRWKYFGRLFQDPYFKQEVMRVWEEFKPRIPLLKEKLELVAESISEAQTMNFAQWPVIGTYLGVSLICLDSWEAEVEYNADFFDERVKWMDEFLSEL